MVNRYDLISPRPRANDKTFWQKIGSAWPQENGGFALEFDALPLADKDGRTRVMMWEPRERQDTAPPSSGHGGGYGRGSSIDDDEIGF